MDDTSMSRGINALLIGLAVFIVMAGSIFYFTVVQGDDDLSVESVRTRWADGGGNETVLVAEVDVTNNMDIEAVLRGYEANFMVNDEQVGTNRTTSLERTLGAGEAGTMEIRIPVPAEGVSGWLRSHVDEDEATNVALDGKAVFSSAKEQQMEVTFEEDWEFETDLADAVGDVANCDSVGDEPCLDGVDVDWTTADRAVVMELTATYNNPTSEPVELGNQTVRLGMGGVMVAKGSTSGPVTLEPGVSDDVTIEVFFEHEQLVSWWPQHVAECESSPARLAFQVDYAAKEKEPPPDDNETDDNQTGGNQTGGNQTDGNTTLADGGHQEAWAPLSQDLAPQAPVNRAVMFQQDQTSSTDGDVQTLDWEFAVGPFETGFTCNQEDP